MVGSWPWKPALRFLMVHVYRQRLVLRLPIGVHSGTPILAGSGKSIASMHPARPEISTATSSTETACRMPTGMHTETIPCSCRGYTWTTLFSMLGRCAGAAIPERSASCFAGTPGGRVASQGNYPHEEWVFMGFRWQLVVRKAI